ncbi:MAG: hypothetical protein HWN68_03590 [Desulfobacterales bacterium]|nr:hypothetical protein [Desulfobacterales bacterium]
MRRAKLFVAAGVAAMVVGMTAQYLVAKRHELVQKVGTHGRVNWSNGIIYAKWVGAASRKFGKNTRAGSTAQKVEMAAYSNLLETVKDMRIDSSTSVKDFMEKHDVIRSQVEAVIKGAEVAKREYLSDGTVEVTLALKLTGGFAQLILPQDIKHVREVKTIPKTAAKEQKPVAAPEPSMPAPAPAAYTGLVLDARGLKGRPAMSPRIIDEEGREVYGSAYVSREFAVQHGMAAYWKDLKAAQKHQRVSGNPLTVRGLRIGGTGRCDFVISNAHASKIRGASENLLFLKKCRVIIVLD